MLILFHIHSMSRVTLQKDIMSTLYEWMPALWMHSRLTFGDWTQALRTVSSSLCCGHRCVVLDCSVILLPILIWFAWWDLLTSSACHIRLGDVGASFHQYRYNSTPGCCKQLQSSRLNSPQLSSTGQWAGALRAAGHFCTYTSCYST